MMMSSSVYYVLNLEMVTSDYQALGYPVYVMYFNGLAKLLGGIAILAPVHKSLKEFAYAGYLYILLLALFAHVTLKDGEHWGALMGLVLWSLSYWLWKKEKRG